MWQKPARPRPGTASSGRPTGRWVAGGYCASALIFNVADGLNHFLVPPTLFDDDTLVTKMVNPDEGRGVASILVGGVAPCVTAPCVGRAELSKCSRHAIDATSARWCLCTQVVGGGPLPRLSAAGARAALRAGRRRDGGVLIIIGGAPPVAAGSAAARGARRDVVLPVPGVGQLAGARGNSCPLERAGVRGDCARVVSCRLLSTYPSSLTGWGGGGGSGSPSTSGGGTKSGGGIWGGDISRSGGASAAAEASSSSLLGCHARGGGRRLSEPPAGAAQDARAFPPRTARPPVSFWKTG